ncbi:paraslipin [Pokkaliibacter sp. MBI-7]|uniref:SPFH domain-containing protein n=1 Tax=Pokkaliibacter sp. MBI-7 TaxID=3040600 RepID=UPI00244AF093|nr:paraslipin [Pokkaliibacter sp. MBI-7]MDH2433401.1 paraslipin [Pokkaliibacter sp. MBI-7]
MDVQLTGGLLITLVIAVLAMVILIKGLRIVQQSEAVVIERLGSYHKTLEPGVNWIVPFVDLPRAIKVKRYMGEHAAAIMVETSRIDRRETVLDFPGQSVITTDNVSVMINGVLYYQIIDPQRAVYQVENLIQSIEVLAKTTLRSEIGKMELDKLFESRQEINASLETVLDEAANKWGVKVTRVEIQDIQIPDEIQDAMRKQMTAERERRAVVRRAEGERQAAIETAEGERQAAILRAQGEREASILTAEGQQQAINLLTEALGSDVDKSKVIGYLIAKDYLNTLPQIAKDGERVFLPYEASATLGSLGMISELFRKDSQA